MRYKDYEHVQSPCAIACVYKNPPSYIKFADAKPMFDAKFRIFDEREILPLRVKQNTHKQARFLRLSRWRFPEIGVPLNHPFIDGFPIINHPFLGTPSVETPR